MLISTAVVKYAVLATQNSAYRRLGHRYSTHIIPLLSCSIAQEWKLQQRQEGKIFFWGQFTATGVHLMEKLGYF